MQNLDTPQSWNKVVQEVEHQSRTSHIAPLVRIHSNTEACANEFTQRWMHTVQEQTKNELGWIILCDAVRASHWFDTCDHEASVIQCQQEEDFRNNLTRMDSVLRHAKPIHLTQLVFVIDVPMEWVASHIWLDYQDPSICVLTIHNDVQAFIHIITQMCHLVLWNTNTYSHVIRWSLCTKYDIDVHIHHQLSEKTSETHNNTQVYAIKHDKQFQVIIHDDQDPCGKLYSNVTKNMISLQYALPHSMNVVDYFEKVHPWWSEIESLCMVLPHYVRKQARTQHPLYDSNVRSIVRSYLF
jgi:hypothetical protein